MLSSVRNEQFGNLIANESLSNGSLIFVEMEEPLITRTDSEGQTSITFGRAFAAPLRIGVIPSGMEAKSSFFIPPSDIKSGTTITLSEPELSRHGKGLGDKIEIRLEVGNWSL